MSKPLSIIFQDNLFYLIQKRKVKVPNLNDKSKFFENELCELLGTSPNPSLQLIEKISKEFGVPAAWLLTDQKRPSSRVTSCQGVDVVCGMLPSIEALQVKMFIERNKEHVEEHLFEQTFE
ncbi:MAG: hypothetical protein KHX35_10975 [Sutterella wadsworthensis]|nr:hypothetical protein [Sutterella wadsworthensis]